MLLSNAGAMSAATLIVISGYSTSAKMAVGSMCAGVALSGLMHSGYEVNILDIAPGVSGVVMGISNTAGTITGFLSPLLVGVMTEDKVSDFYRVFHQASSVGNDEKQELPKYWPSASSLFDYMV